ncbi:alpha/beta fold hydrolase [Derxia lacustris]|uniref:alpha/beta fold hydrolase n=1 Tax=Derxia lacustris TaxID=764842 RepID=UPI000A174746|nr:alpha/beta fold hydrolase [Derxia lacustris]
MTGSIPSYYSQEVHGPFQTFELGNFVLESGARLRNAQLAYATFGELSPARDNAILFPSWYSGSNKILELAYLGSGRALDPARYFIILVNQLGNGLSSSPSNTPSPFNAARFPTVSVGDDVRAQHRLLTEKFGIEQLQLVLGGSMGAQITYEWAVSQPQFVRRAAPIAGTARATPHNRLLVETFIEAITSDPAWDGGWYEASASVHRGLRRHARLFAASGFTPALFNHAGWAGLGFTTTDDFLIGFVENHFLAQDPNNLIALARKWQSADVSRHANGDLAAALARIQARTAVIAIEEDGFFPFDDIVAEQTLIARSELHRISSRWGHLALFGTDAGYNASIDRILLDLLAQS